MNLKQLQRLVSFLPAGALGIAALAACHNDASATERTSTMGPTVAPTPSAAPEPARPSKIVDADIAAAVERHFLDERLLRAEHVRVGVRQGVADLTGSVGSLLAQKRAVRVAETIRGVRSIVDELTVTPAPRTDAQLEADVKSALQDDKATRGYAIGVTAKSGTVLLSGKADSWQEKQAISEVAEAVPGLNALVNAMTVGYAAVRSESEIATEVRHRLANDAWLDGDTLVVEVGRHERTVAFPNDGIDVHVVGTVGSVAQKSRANADAWVAGVDQVDDNGVSVDWFAQNDQRRTANAPVRSDAEIAQAVKDAFRFDPRLKSLAPQVAVQNGLVVLSGIVESPKARGAAAGDAADTLGVWRVRDELLVEGSSKPADAELETIQVSSASGSVTLKGSVATGSERLDAVEEAATLPGVAEVEDDLTVTGPTTDLKARIEEWLFWDPRVDRSAVSVAVTPDGVTTLTGAVNAWSEMKAAGDDALRGGATRVVNQLKWKKHPEAVAR
jgi:osmotically-inducible protein OsmY